MKLEIKEAVFYAHLITGYLWVFCYYYETQRICFVSLIDVINTQFI